MPENCDGKNTELDATKFTLVAHHKECTTPVFTLMPTTAPGTKAPAYELNLMLNAGMPATENPTLLKN
jgi:hypothetical protein